MTMNANPSISVALPAYNEQENIVAVVNDALQKLQETGLKHEVIVIDNCSSDNTAALVESSFRSNPTVRLIRHRENMLYSGSCNTAMTEFRMDLLAIVDSDGQYAIEDIPNFLEELRRNKQLVIGWRRHRSDPFMRKAISLVFNALGKLWLSYPFHDFNCGFRVMTRPFTARVKIAHRINMSNPELFMRARLYDFAVGEVVIQHFHRERGVTCHNLFKFWKLFADVNAYMKLLRCELYTARSAVNQSAR